MAMAAGNSSNKTGSYSSDISKITSWNNGWNPHPAPHHDSIEGDFQKLVDTNTKIIQELFELEFCIQEYQKKLRMVKTAGTSVGAVGAVSMVAGLCLAPFSGGTSTLLTMGGLAATGKKNRAWKHIYSNIGI